MKSLIRKTSTAWRIMTTKGIGAVVYKIRSVMIGWWTSDHWWLGRILELRGNIVVLDGCRFDLSNPVVGTPQKAGFLLGNYENGERAALGYIPSDLNLALVEFGGSIGAMACVSSKHFGNPARHVVVEANPYMIPVLTRNRDLNGCHFQIIHAALAHGTETVTFYVHQKFVESNLYHNDSSAQAVTVPTVTLHSTLERCDFDGMVVVFCDAEGAETGLFEFERELLSARVKYLCIEFHPPLTGAKRVSDMQQQLGEMGFRLLYHHKDNYLYINRNL